MRQFKHRPSLQFPDTSAIKNENVRAYLGELHKLLNKISKDIYDDLVGVELIENTTGTPTAASHHRGKQLLLRGTGGATDVVYIGVDTGSGGYGFKTVTLT